MFSLTVFFFGWHYSSLAFQVPLLSSLKRAQLETLFVGLESAESSGGLLRAFSPGEVVAAAGEACDTLFVVHRWRLALFFFFEFI